MKTIIIGIIAILSLTSCSSMIRNIKTVFNPQEISGYKELPDRTVLKLHLRDGSIIVFQKWFLDEQQKQVIGTGHKMGPLRISKTKLKHYQVSLDDCLLAETNTHIGVNAISPLIMTLPTIVSIVTLPCISDPKACFGSCPTFYSIEAKDSLKIQAEGFSSSIARSMEATDIDIIDAKPESSNFPLVLKNEAYETHYIRNIELLVFPVADSERVMQSSSGFFKVSNFEEIPLQKNKALYHDLHQKDGKEYFSTSNSFDLSEKETIILNIQDKEAEDIGLLITKRQSLMTTFLFYQSIAYMGSKAGDYLATFERKAINGRKEAVPLFDILGGIEIKVRLDGKWHHISEIKEAGPIVSDSHLVPINKKGVIDQISLTMVKGLWRIDELALVEVGNKVEPIVVPPSELWSGDLKDHEKLSCLIDSNKYLVNLPGAEYRLNFRLPDSGKMALFLRSKGYYIEWMRGDWLEEQDLRMVKMLYKQPEKWMKIMAPKYKKAEPEMEELFWNSKFNAK